MPLTIGSRLAHYDVTALIGEGGMGQVYQATDTKLNRQVALKIPPEAFASEPDRPARFQRGAQATPTSRRYSRPTITEQS
jgi:serine/threonine-protein kinase